MSPTRTPGKTGDERTVVETIAHLMRGLVRPFTGIGTDASRGPTGTSGGPGGSSRGRDRGPTRQEAVPNERRRVDSGDQLVTDETCVLQVLQEAEHGMCWQNDLPQTLDWSPAKTSRVLSAMEREDEVVRYRVGRKKVVRHPETASEGTEGTGRIAPP